jgi:hypothetical protein
MASCGDMGAKEGKRGTEILPLGMVVDPSGRLEEVAKKIYNEK